VLLYRTAALGGTTFGSFRLRDGQEMENLKALDLPIQSLLSFQRYYASGGPLARGSFCKNRPWTPQKLFIKGVV